MEFFVCTTASGPCHYCKTTLFSAVSFSSPPNSLEMMRIAEAVLDVIIAQPLRVIGTLRRLGHEPVPPRQCYSFISGQYLWYYPGIIGYTRGLIRERGWLGLYRGFTVCVVDSIVGNLVLDLCQPLVTYLVTRIPENMTTNVGFGFLLRLARMFLYNSLLHCLVEVIRRPFQVMAVRAIAQHVGQETVYSSVLQAVRHIYSEEGITGFYSGLAPALIRQVIGSVVIVIATMVAEILVSSDRLRTPAKRILSASFSMICCHPYLVMSDLMAVNNSRLAIVSRHFTDWRDCWRHLRATNNLYRADVFRLLFPHVAHNHIS